MGEPGVCTSSSIGRGSLGGLVRWYDMSATEVSNEDRCDRVAGVESEAAMEMGTGLLGRSCAVGGFTGLGEGEALVVAYS